MSAALSSSSAADTDTICSTSTTSNVELGVMTVDGSRLNRQRSPARWKRKLFSYNSISEESPSLHLANDLQELSTTSCKKERVANDGNVPNFALTLLHNDMV
ncbi:hypothetical protein HELRODRAFT_160801 [Helobdella robusta]|uniref:Uncharacterized protein n=1 Tax=Helobdella robusta TaxID=6412 RepID=T1EQQ5_HELRO|nr:hypothetical protein HELRODRAFT_160801 [Helobdella robusta]ESO06611.1 hypothetical protein HELRODRAFT_160801 [Helobdella robusta]